MLINFTNDNLTEYIRKESVIIVNAISFVSKNKETLSLCISKLSGKKLNSASSLMNILDYNLNSLQDLHTSLEGLKDITSNDFSDKVTVYNNLFSATFHQLFNTTSNVESIAQELLNAPQPKEDTPKEEAEKPKELKDNNTLLISEKDNKVYLPYKKKNIENILTVSEKYNTPEDVISNLYTIPLSAYSSSASSRFREGFNLMRKKECASFFKSIDLGLELLSRYDLNPAIISACGNLDELDIYLDCLDNNELDEFDIFNVKYEVAPTVVKQKNNF